MDQASLRNTQTHLVRSRRAEERGGQELAFLVGETCEELISFNTYAVLLGWHFAECLDKWSKVAK